MVFRSETNIRTETKKNGRRVAKVSDGDTLVGVTPVERSEFVFLSRDGYGIRALGRRGIQVAILSGRRSMAVRLRARDLGISHVLQGIDDKLAAFQRLHRRLGLSAAQCACIGDDTPDAEMMRAAGLAFAVADAHADALAAADVITHLPGGRGAVREVCDRLLAARGR